MRIRTLRKDHGWTQEELSDRSGVSVATIRNTEHAAGNSTRRTLQDLSMAFGQRKDYLSDVLVGRAPRMQERTVTTGQERDADRTAGRLPGRRRLRHRPDVMDVVALTRLTGTAAEIKAKVREAVRLAPDDELAGTRLRELAAVFAVNPLLRVTVVTYTGAQGLEVLLRGARQRDAVTMHVYPSGTWCRIVWDTLAPIRTAESFASTVGLVTTILHTGRQSGLRHDPLDPHRIIDDLSESEQGNFLAEYRRALDGAQDPAGWEDLQKVLRLWRFRAAVANDPGYWQARKEALAGTGDRVLLEDYLRQRRGVDEH